MDANTSIPMEVNTLGCTPQFWTIKDLFEVLHQTPVQEIKGHFPASFNQQVQPGSRT